MGPDSDGKMSMRRFLAAMIAIIGLFSTTAGAEQSYPDLKGIWIGMGSGAFVEARLLGEDAIEPCCVRISAFSQMATCEELKRKN
jgi:hypothetical protein